MVPALAGLVRGVCSGDVAGELAWDPPTPPFVTTPLPCRLLELHVRTPLLSLLPPGDLSFPPPSAMMPLLFLLLLELLLVMPLLFRLAGLVAASLGKGAVDCAPVKLGEVAMAWRSRESWIRLPLLPGA